MHPAVQGADARPQAITISHYSEFEQRVTDFAERVNGLGTEAAQLEWLQLLQGAAAVGDSQDLTNVMELKQVCVNEALELPLLLDVLELAPCFHGRGVKGAAEALLKQCLEWAGALDPSVWPVLLDRLQQACQPVSKQVETELQVIFMRMLGEDGTRVLMARPRGGIGACLAEAPLWPSDASVQSDSLFMKLPRELRLAIIGWLIPAPACLQHTFAVRRHGPTLAVVCHGLRDEVGPLLSGAWRRADRLPGTPAQATEALAEQFETLLGALTAEQVAALDPEDRESRRSETAGLIEGMKQLACTLCLQADAEEVRAAMAACLALCDRFRAWLSPSDWVPSICLIVCLTHEGQESSERFKGLVALVLAAAKRNDCMDRLADALHLHLVCYAPPECLEPLGNLHWDHPHSFAYRACVYFMNAGGLSDQERFACVWGLGMDTVSANELAAMRLLSETHELSQAQRDSLLTTPEWWDMCAQVLGRLLTGLDAVWPHDVPLPPLSLSHRLPPDLLRWAFHCLDHRLRASLLKRPFAVGEDGCGVLPVALWCDFCLDTRIARSQRIHCLSQWVQESPELAEAMRAVACDWQVPSGPPLACDGPGPAQDRE